MAADTPNISYGSTSNRVGPNSLAAALSADAFMSLGSMEGVYDPVVSRAPAGEAVSKRALLAPGYVLAAGVAALSYLIHVLPVAPFTVGGDSGLRHPVSATIIAILIGLACRNLLSLPEAIRAGCRHAVKKVIPVAIVLTGAGMNMAHLASVGLVALAITVICIVVAIVGAYYIGRLIGLSWKTSLLLGTGTGICGNSAIVAVAPLIDADDDDLVLSIGAVNLFGLVAMLAWPVIGGMIHLSDEMFGVWSGTSIHAVPQVVAAGFAYSAEAGTLATLVKLVRVTMLAPLVFVLAVLYAKHHQGESSGDGRLTVRYARLVPWFVWGFVLLALCSTLGLLPTLRFELSGLLSASGDSVIVQAPLAAVFTGIGKILLTVAMAAIGLEVNLRALAGVGGRAVRAGLLSTGLLGAASLVLITLFMQR